MAGLDSIKKYQAGSTVTAAPEAQGTIPYQPGKNTGIAEKIALDPTQTENILANMQQYINERQGILPSLSRGLTRGMATAYGPASLAAIDREQALQDKQIMEYQQTMAAYRAAQAQAQRDAEEYKQKMQGGPGTGGVSTSGGVMTYNGIPVPDSVQAQLTNNATANKAVIDAWLKTRTTEFTKGEANPSSLDRKPTVIFNPITKQPEVRDVNLQEYWDLKAKNLIKQPSEYYEQQGKPEITPSAKPAVAPAVKPASDTILTSTQGDNLPKMQKAVFSTESSSGQADTTKPSIQGAMGPMQITPDTWKTFVARGVIPADYDINNAEQNKDAGDRILAFYNTKYKGDPDKTFAAYHGGEGAINPDGSINLDRKDALGTTIGQYIAMNKARAGLANDIESSRGTGVQVASTGFPDVSAILRQRDIEKEEGTAAAKKRGESGEAARADFENDIRPANIIEDKETSKRIQTLVKENPAITGVLAGPGYAKAIAGQLERGIGNVTVNDLSTAILQTLPSTTNLTVSQRNELGTYLARMELKAAKLIKGQGQITEGEREILQRASSSLKDPAEAIYKKARMLERITDMNAELGEIYGDGSKYPNFRTFSMSKDPRVLDIHRRYQKDLNDILNEPVNFARPTGTAKPATKHPEDIQNIINRNKPKKDQ